uniref:Uncharacterized protein n=1 Tax=Lactuca sativa TaxID=4236 RepID=A0A9R1WR16_LACSA|nr:hypothetical protein LSAT_V11C100017040 [Lactuca sativa]
MHMNGLKPFHPSVGPALTSQITDKFCGTYMSIGKAHCDALLNNLCETLNSKIFKGRDKPIITCLEFIREYIIKKLLIIQNTIDKCCVPLTPIATKTIEKIKIKTAVYMGVLYGNEKYKGEGVDQCVVNIVQL